MRLKSMVAFAACALTLSAGATEPAGEQDRRKNALTMDTWYRVGVTKAQSDELENIVAGAMTTPVTTKLVFNLRRH